MGKKIRKMQTYGQTGRVVNTLFLVLFLLAFLALAIFSVLQMLRGERFSTLSQNDAGTYAYLEPDEVLGSIGTDEDGLKYVIVAENADADSLYWSVVCMSQETYDSIQDWENYTWGEGDMPATKVRFTGYAENYFSDLTESAREGVAYLWDEEVSEQDFTNYFGATYLDTTQSWHFAPNVWFFFALLGLVLFIFLLVSLIMNLRSMARCTAVTRGTMERLQSGSTVYSAAAEQVENDQAQQLKNAKLYLAGDVVFSYGKCFDMFRVSEVTEIYGHTSSGGWASVLLLGGLVGALAAAGSQNHRLVVLTSDGLAHEIAPTMSVRAVHDPVVQYILARNRNVALGADHLRLGESEDTASFSVSRIVGFYSTKKLWAGRAQSTVTA